MRRLIAILTASLLTLPAARASDPATCGTVVVPTGLGMSSTPAPVATLHPALYTGALYETEMINLLYRPLVWVGASGQADWTASLASGIAANADRTVFTVTLKPYLWSDGKPVTAADVLYDWRLVHALGAAYSQYGSGGVPMLIRDVHALDDHRVEFDLTKPVSPEWFELGGLSQFYALPRQAWSRYDIPAQQTLQSQASFYRVVDGPFRLDELHLGRYAVLSPNARYGGHQATIRRLVVNFLQGGDPLEALASGQIDMADLPFELWSASARLGDLRRVAVGPSPLFASLIPNIKSPIRPFLADARVRDAIARAIDQARIASAVYHGTTQPQSGMVPPVMTDLLAPDLRQGPSPLGYDPAAARALLDAAGWKTALDGVRAKNGQRLAFTVLVTAASESGLQSLQLIASDLARIGVAIDIKQAEFNQLIARMLGPPDGWDVVYMGWSILTYPDPNQFFATGASGNYAHYSDPTMDRLLAAASASPGRDALFAVEDYVVAQQPMIFLPDGSATVLVRPGITGVRRFLSANGYWSPEYLRLAGAMACDAAHA